MSESIFVSSNCPTCGRSIQIGVGTMPPDFCKSCVRVLQQLVREFNSRKPEPLPTIGQMQKELMGRSRTMLNELECLKGISWDESIEVFRNVSKNEIINHHHIGKGSVFQLESFLKKYGIKLKA